MGNGNQKSFFDGHVRSLCRNLAQIVETALVRIFQCAVESAGSHGLTRHIEAASPVRPLPSVLRLSLPRSSSTALPYFHLYFSHSRKLPRKAFALLPSRDPAGSYVNFLLFPPPRTT